MTDDISKTFDSFVDKFMKRLPDDARCYSKEIEEGLRWFSAKIMTEFPVPLKLKKFMIQEAPGELLWVEHVSGKGFHIGKSKLDKLVKKLSGGRI